MSKQEKILALLESGKIIRLMDGRCGDSFVDIPALNALIQQKRVKVYDNKGVDFVRAYTHAELLAKEAAKVAALKQENEQLKHVAALAIAAVCEKSVNIPKNRPMFAALDEYLANQLPDQLWEELNEAAKKIEREVKQ